jgi:hypothetical protein
MKRFAVALAALTLATGGVVAGEMPMPQMFRNAPFQKGQWKVDVLEMNMKGGPQRGGRPGAITMCMQDLREMGRDRAEQEGGKKSDCSYRLLKDTATEALMETICEDGTRRTTMTREGDRTFLMQSQGMRHGEPYSMKARYTYEGAQCTQSGIGTRMDRNSPECEKARARAASMNPGTMCANAGANRAMCEQNVARMRAQLESACK